MKPRDAALVLPLILSWCVALLLLFAGSCSVQGCGGSVETADCADGGGCFCAVQEDVETCLSLGPTMRPFCCTDHGGNLIGGKPRHCGEPPGCVVKPGILDGGGMNANFCCPE